ncbi:hypothetical protein PR002_g7494 [Phytophthora rubi]|uniref:Uncharacterized protein n=1 Tax=Phytophthora rubi TaxID=129364 RepID=A0A6A3N211_9STRA|nr:hypothetical protein PR002_g7494 [Phytophthora rubi]
MTSESSPYQSKISLTPSDSTQLQVVAKAILDANLDRYQLFSDVDNGRVDPNTWKLVKSKNEMRAYLQRQRRRVSFPFQVNPGEDNCALQSLLCVGSSPGTLDSVMREVEKNVRLVSSDMKVTRRRLVFCSPSPCLGNAMAQNDPELSLRDNAGGVARFYRADYIRACVVVHGILGLSYVFI